eukprot:8348075-Pyramimonas_sp.AAC.1
MSRPVSSTSEQSQHETLIPLTYYPDSERKDFKAKVQELAKKKDIGLGAESAKSLNHGSHAERVGKSLPDIPADLLHLHDLVLPIRKFEPVEQWDEGPSGNAEQLLELIPTKAKLCVKWRLEYGAVSISDGTAKATTRAIVKWRWT